MILKSINSRLLYCVFGIVFILITGTIGYCLIEEWSIHDGFYMSLITMSTVGFGETRELTAVGRVFTSFLILLSIVGMSCWSACFTSLIVSGDLTGSFARKRVKRKVAQMNNHTIIFGSGTIAQIIADRLSRQGSEIVVIDDDPVQVQWFREQLPNVAVLEMNPRNELALAEANVFSAKNIVTVLESDFDNMLIAMSAKELGLEIQIISRSNDPRVSSRMLKTCVDEVICPFQVTADQIADIITC